MNDLPKERKFSIEEIVEQRKLTRRKETRRKRPKKPGISKVKVIRMTAAQKTAGTYYGWMFTRLIDRSFKYLEVKNKTHRRLVMLMIIYHLIDLDFADVHQIAKAAQPHNDTNGLILEVLRDLMEIDLLSREKVGPINKYYLSRKGKEVAKEIHQFFLDELGRRLPPLLRERKQKNVTQHSNGDSTGLRN